MEAAHSSNTLVNVYQTIQCDIQEDSILCVVCMLVMLVVIFILCNSYMLCFELCYYVTLIFLPFSQEQSKIAKPDIILAHLMKTIHICGMVIVTF
jgi:hypothetical protein